MTSVYVHVTDLRNLSCLFEDFELTMKLEMNFFLKYVAVAPKCFRIVVLIEKHQKLTVIQLSR